MTLRTDINPRYFSTQDPLRHELQRLVESAQQALNAIPRISFRWVRGVVATGTGGTALVSVAWDERTPPDVAVLVRVMPVADATSDPGDVTARLNFDFGADGVVVYEPAGLTANATYDFVVMFVGGVP